MVIVKGVPASKGIAIGKVLLKHGSFNDFEVKKVTVEDPSKELARVEQARQEAEEELQELYLTALARVGKENSMIFQIHIMMLRDVDLFNTISKVILEERANAEYAVYQAARKFWTLFDQIDDEYMKGRAADLIDICKRLMGKLSNVEDSEPFQLTSEAIVGAGELMPSETIQMDRSKVLAFVTRQGSSTSHAAILSRTMGIPAVVSLGTGYDNLKNHSLAIVDGTAGVVIIEPDDEMLTGYLQKRAEFQQHREELQQYRAVSTVTRGGRSLAINANIGGPADVPKALEQGAEGIGLFRSEYLYMEQDRFPNEEEQFQAYRAVLEEMGSRLVIIRTLDLGADKEASCMHLQPEANPALGYRAIRLCLDYPMIFMTQLRALLRASVYGNLAVMFPMVTSVEQVVKARAMLNQAKEQLRGEGTAFVQNFQVGIMVETPAAVMIADELAKEVDFFSVGTNDLTQYTLAVDRSNTQISQMYDPKHPAVLRMIEMTAESARKAGIWVGICGESAADPELTDFFLRIGVKELSVAPSAILELRKSIRQLD